MHPTTQKEQRYTGEIQELFCFRRVQFTTRTKQPKLRAADFGRLLFGNVRKGPSGGTQDI